MKYGHANQITLEDGSVVNGFEVHIRNPKKSAIVRLPTAQEISDLYQKESQDKSKDKTSYLRFHLELFNKIRLDNGDAFDEYEASGIIAQLCHASVVSCDKSDDEYHITIKTCCGEVVHHLRFPTYKEMAVHRNSTSTNGYKAAVTLYDALYLRTENYADGFTTSDIPKLHKAVVVNEVIVDHYSIDPVSIDPNS